MGPTGIAWRLPASAMKTSSIEELALLPEVQAVRKHFDAINYRILRLYFLVFACVGLGLAINGMAEGGGARNTVAGLVMLAGNAGLFLARKSALFTRFYAFLVPGYAAVQLVLPGLFLPAWIVPPTPIFSGIALLLLLLQPAEHLLLFGTFWFVQLLGLGASNALFGDSLVGMTAAVVSWLACALIRTQISRRRFLRRWRTDSTHTRDRLRMREELESARRIQLGMLPEAPPDLGWIELAASSTPATEVGGDYYDYFRLAPQRVAVVIADVAGHGLASALLLSGLRSCLYLLGPELAAPVPVLERLTGMVRATGGGRTFVTLLAAVFDQQAGCVRVAAAGHPPAFHRDGRSGAVTPLGQPAAALGTFVGSPYAEVEHAVAPGDLLVFYTDGVVETRDGRGEEFGEERLLAALAATAPGAGAAEVRDAILLGLDGFRGAAEPQDDFTVVVARLA